MTELLNQGLLITAIGMGLVFLALILLWGLMALMVRIPLKEKVEAEEIVAVEEVDEAAPAADDRHALRVRAAAAAVAAALSLNKRVSVAAPPASNSVSSWQAAKRTSQMNLNQSISYRKSRGSAR